MTKGSMEIKSKCSEWFVIKYGIGKVISFFILSFNKQRYDLFFHSVLTINSLKSKQTKHRFHWSKYSKYENIFSKRIESKESNIVYYISK